MNTTCVAIIAILAGLLLMLLATFSPRAAEAHAWYDLSCCSEEDCRPISNAALGTSEVSERADGYYWSNPQSGKTPFFPHGSSKIKPSRDGNFHGCESVYTKQGLCLYIPTMF